MDGHVDLHKPSIYICFSCLDLECGCCAAMLELEPCPCVMFQHHTRSRLDVVELERPKGHARLVLTLCERTRCYVSKHSCSRRLQTKSVQMCLLQEENGTPSSMHCDTDVGS